MILSQACERVTPWPGTELVFDSMDGYYFLRQVWVAGNARGRELPRSHTEIRLAQNYDKMESVIVAANIAK